MDEGDMSGDENHADGTENAENAKRAKIETAATAVGDPNDDNSTEVSREQKYTLQGAGSSTICRFNSVRRNSIKRRNYRKSGEGDSSDVEESASDPPTELEIQVANRTDGSDSDEDLVNAELRAETPPRDHRSETSSSTIIRDTESESDDDPPAVLKKEKPKHNWFIVPEIINRQLGNRAYMQNNIQFQRRCYRSLHCVERLELMYKLDGHEGCVNCLNFHPDGTLLCSGSDDLNVVLWDWPIGKQLLCFETKHRGNIFQSKFMPLSGDLHIVTCGRDGQVRLNQVSKQEGYRSSRKLGCHRGPCHKLALPADQPHIIISAGEDGIVFRHDVRNTRPEKIVMVGTDIYHGMPLYSVSTHPLNTHEFCVCGRDHNVRVYDERKCGATEPEPLYKLYPKKKNNDVIGLHITCAIYNHDGSEILASYNDDDVYTFDPTAPSGSFVRQYQGHRNGATIKGVNYFGPKSEFIVSGSDCGYVYFWERNTEAIVQWLLADDNGVVNCLEPHPQLPFIATSGLDWDVKLWVPSCEQKPVMAGLADTVKQNNLARCRVWATAGPEASENDSMWLVWRYLPEMLERNRSRVQESSSSSGSLESDDDEDDDDDFEDDDDDDEDDRSHLITPSGCTTT